jgi:Cas5fv helical domain
VKITIEYEASWRNSFLDGDNNHALPVGGRGYLGSMTTLKKEGNFIERQVTLDTVMGLLNRLIGDQRKLYQARKQTHQTNYFFEDIESKVSFEDKPLLTSEIVYVRNMKGSTDQNSFTGMIKSDDPILSSDYSAELWGILKLSLDELCNFILNDNKVQQEIDPNPLLICALIEELEVLKPVENAGRVAEAIVAMTKHFPDTDYLNNKGQVITSSLYCSALYIQVKRLAAQYDLSTALTKSGGLSGISKRGFTKKDFMDRYTTGKKKILWGNPFMKKEKTKGQGEVTSMLTKANGQLEINIDVDMKKGQEIKDLIECAGVSAFYLGKKGLAYVSNVRV